MTKCLLVIVIFVLTSWSAFAATIFFEDFENGVNIQSQTSGVLVGTQFQVLSGSVDVVTPSDTYTTLCVAPTSGVCIDTYGGNNNGGGVIETVNPIDFEAGNYMLSFDLIGWYFPNSDLSRAATVEVWLGALFIGSFDRVGANNPYPTENVAFNFGAPTSEHLRFANVYSDSGYAGAVLDNIRIEAVPEPATMLLTGLGLLVAGIFHRRRSTKNAKN
ncbi:MAG: PEP-CTERM sorting domain-containing protein [Candidatus Paceibacterota bacterium]